MKRLVLTLSILFSVSAFAQNHFIGVKGGLNMNNAAAPNYDGTGSQVGYAGGLSYSYQFAKHHVLEVEVIYIQKNFLTQIAFLDAFGRITGDNITIESSYDYVSLPIKRGIVFGKKVSGFANLGIVPSLLLAAESKIPAIEGADGERTLDLKENTTKFDFGALVEAGANFQVQPGLLFTMGVTFQHSFVNAAREDNTSGGEFRPLWHLVFFWCKVCLKKGQEIMS